MASRHIVLMASRKHKWTLIILVVALLAPLFADGAAMTAKSIRKALAKVGKKALKAVKSSGSKSSAEFCWKNSYGRGVGKIPESCKPGQDRIGLLCYDKCPPNFARFGFDCHQVCSRGFEDQGLFCRKKEYGRGGGYPWKFGDRAFRLDGARERCERDHGRGRCEQNGAMMYPKCKEGYYPFGCCMCRPNRFDCKALGYQGQLDLSCSKHVRVSKPHVGVCPAGQENQAGLCYKTCTGGFKGVGPVCWGQPPSGWVNCGMGAAVDSFTCAEILADQILSVGQLALNVVSGGASSGLKSGWKLIKSKGLIKKLRKKVDGKLGFDFLDKLEASKDPADMVRLAASITAMLDPTGASDVVQAYAYSTCDKVTQ
ncbi:hypothetical protein H310_02481 [Aphanomyces invadans]|uniref:Uncharacterized protein n=1 Tax=Aphanomyces invadans TaxID=157072 RepID=A0A024UNW2_9STRA|nr:hypothetical protein H310_02481 [Aphanomyces invadans]ETW08141.1 hypothetical protein H310_02481 [Aphanomyces invadans]|eukprot:XP_008864234.1 hypothetical protein H310_02481 [Aphanomyces invadans]